jgi:hypothetical protein
MLELLLQSRFDATQIAVVVAPHQLFIAALHELWSAKAYPQIDVWNPPDWYSQKADTVFAKVLKQTKTRKNIPNIFFMFLFLSFIL